MSHLGVPLLVRKPRRPTILELARPDLVFRRGKPFWKHGKEEWPAIAGGMDAYYATALPPFAPALGVASAASAARQEITPLPAPILPANAVRPGSILKIEAEGEWSATATPTLILGLFAGIPTTVGGGTVTTIFGETAAQTLSAQTSWPWRMEYRGKVTTIGTTGSITGTGDLEIALTAINAYSVTAALPITLALRTVAINTTVANAIGVAATFSVSNAANTARAYSMTAMLLN